MRKLSAFELVLAGFVGIAACVVSALPLQWPDLLEVAPHMTPWRWVCEWFKTLVPPAAGFCAALSVILFLQGRVRCEKSVEE
jgi:hypothetical protein